MIFYTNIYIFIYFFVGSIDPTSTNMHSPLTLGLCFFTPCHDIAENREVWGPSDQDRIVLLGSNCRNWFGLIWTGSHVKPAKLILCRIGYVCYMVCPEPSSSSQFCTPCNLVNSHNLVPICQSIFKSHQCILIRFVSIEFFTYTSIHR